VRSFLRHDATIFAGVRRLSEHGAHMSWRLPRKSKKVPAAASQFKKNDSSRAKVSAENSAEVPTGRPSIRGGTGNAAGRQHLQLEMPHGVKQMDASTGVQRTPEVQGTPGGAPAIRTIAMPLDTNPAGDIFGGWLMALMDLAAGSVAARHARGRCATVGVDGICFRSPVKVGDEVSVWADLLGIGTTSMRLQVSVWRRARDGENMTKVTEAVFTYVSLDSDGHPRPVKATAIAVLRDA
jgi:acyl-CoA thioesterase YciA